jgi:hypothetical protein
MDPNPNKNTDLGSSVVFFNTSNCTQLQHLSYEYTAER